MHSKVREWLSNDVTKAQYLELKALKEQALEDLLNVEGEEERIKKIERIKVYTEILDYDNFFMGLITDEN